MVCYRSRAISVMIGWLHIRAAQFLAKWDPDCMCFYSCSWPYLADFSVCGYSLITYDFMVSNMVSFYLISFCFMWLFIGPLHYICVCLWDYGSVIVSCNFVCQSLRSARLGTQFCLCFTAWPAQLHHPASRLQGMLVHLHTSTSPAVFCVLLSVQSCVSLTYQGNRFLLNVWPILPLIPRLALISTQSRPSLEVLLDPWSYLSDLCQRQNCFPRDK